MSYEVDLQIACQETLPISQEQLILWAQSPLKLYGKTAEITLRLVDSEEIQQLNKAYRKKDKPTNVLAFPSSIPKVVELDCPFVGDVIICPKVLIKESEEQNKDLLAHCAHIVIHGVLHLLGFDHINPADAKKMQEQEVCFLQEFGFANPYNDEENNFDEQRG